MNEAWRRTLPALLLLATPAIAAAQPAPVEQHGEAVPEEVPEDDVTKWEVSLGGVLQTGNTQAYTITGASLFELIRGSHGFTAEAQGNLGRAVPGDSTDDEYVDTAQNVRLRLRYDFYLTPMDALFVAVLFRHDPFAGLDYRAQGQVGYMRNFFKEENHRFWGEIGYDLTYDNYDPDPLIVDMVEQPGTATVHSARLFAGYLNELNEAVLFRTGVEALINLEGPSDTRINWETSLRSSIAGNFKLEVKLLVQLDTEPVPGNEKLDTTTTVNLLYTLL